MKRCSRCHKDISDADFVGYCRSCVSDKGSYKLSDKIYVCKLWTYIYVENTDNKFCVINTDLIFELIRKINVDNLIYNKADDCIKCGSELFRDIVERIGGANCYRNDYNSFDFRINNKF